MSKTQHKHDGVMSSLNDPVYLVTDALMRPLHKSRTTGRVFGDKPLPLQIGPFTITLPMRFRDDITKGDVCGGVVKFRKGLWGYVYAHGPSRRLFMALFDGKSAGIKTDEIDKYTLIVPAKTLAKIKPHIKAVFAYDDAKLLWQPSAFDDMVEFTTATSPQFTG